MRKRGLVALMAALILCGAAVGKGADAVDEQDRTALEPYYNGYEEGRLPKIRKQGSDGACWAFAAMGAVEADLIADGRAERDEIDLSELQIAYFSTHAFTDPMGLDNGGAAAYEGSDYLSNGGNVDVAVTFLSNNVGAVEERRAPYAKGSGFVPDGSLAVSANVFRVTGAYRIPIGDEAGIKKAIKEHGSVAASYYAKDGSRGGKEAHYSGKYNSFYGEVDADSHAVLLVGWDDKFPKENFHEGCRPDADGAWLARNSWGLDGYGQRGYFWLSYHDAGLAHAGHVVAFDADDKPHDHCYTYDASPVDAADTLSEGDELRQSYPVRTGEVIKAVGVSIKRAGKSLRVKVEADGGEVRGTIATPYPGYYVVELDDGILVKRDAVAVVSVSAEGGFTPLFESTKRVKFGGVAYQGTKSALSETTVVSGGKAKFWDVDARIKLFTDDRGADRPAHARKKPK